MKKVEYFCDLLQQQYIIIVEEDISKLKRILDNMGVELPFCKEEMEKIHGCFWIVETESPTFVAYIWSQKADTGTLIHELYHALYEAASRKFRPTRKNEELWARMLETFWRRVIEPLTSKKRKKKK